ncbi:MAG: Rieske 2Fe-2S domain-containing protein [Desulfosarcinaceae bacterium]
MLNYIWMGSIALLTLQTGGLGIYYALPRFKAGEFGGRIKVGRVVDLPSPGDPPLSVPKGKFWLVRSEQSLLALYKACTHLDCMFDWNPHEGKFICPCHGSQFARDGRLLSGPAPRSLDHFPIQIISPDGDILAQTKDERGLVMPPVAGADASGAPSVTSTPAPGASKAISPEALVWVDTGRKIMAASQAG